MKKTGTIIAFLFCVAAYSFAGQGMGPGPGIGAVAAAPSGQSFSDDFSGDLSAWAITGTVQISSGTLAFMDNEYSLMLAIYNTQTDNVSQYVKFEATGELTTYMGVILRYTDASSPYYIINQTGSDNWGWYSYSANGEDEAEEGAPTALTGFVNPDYVGVTITGTGTGTTVKVWLNPVADAPDAGGATWDSGAAAITWVASGGLTNTADTGRYLGLGGSQGDSTNRTADNFFGGDVP